jgi:hypothetical protein
MIVRSRFSNVSRETSLPDAKIAKDDVEDFLNSDTARNLAQGGGRMPKIVGSKLRKLGVKKPVQAGPAVLKSDSMARAGDRRCLSGRHSPDDLGFNYSEKLVDPLTGQSGNDRDPARPIRRWQR